MLVVHCDSASIFCSTCCRLGDQIISVNGTNLEDVTHTEAVQTLKYSGKDVKLVSHYCPISPHLPYHYGYINTLTTVQYHLTFPIIMDTLISLHVYNYIDGLLPCRCYVVTEKLAVVSTLDILHVHVYDCFPLGLALVS